MLQHQHQHQHQHQQSWVSQNVKSITIGNYMSCSSWILFFSCWYLGRLTIFTTTTKQVLNLSEIYIFSVSENTEEVNKRLGSYIEFFITASYLFIFHISVLSLFFCLVGQNQSFRFELNWPETEARSITGLIKGSLVDPNSGCWSKKLMSNFVKHPLSQGSS